MIAVFLCAGFATRMYPMTRNFPKPLLPVADRPVLDYLMDQVNGVGGRGRTGKHESAGDDRCPGGP